MPHNRAVLLLEDDTLDVIAFKRALAEAGVKETLVVKDNGETGLSYLHEQKDQMPGLIVLDLNMPKMNGLEFLAAVKKNHLWSHIPVVVLTTSRSDEDRSSSFRHGAAGYFVKSIDFKDFVQSIRLIFDYWKASESPWSQVPEDSRI